VIIRIYEKTKVRKRINSGTRFAAFLLLLSLFQPAQAQLIEKPFFTDFTEFPHAEFRRFRGGFDPDSPFNGNRSRKVTPEGLSIRALVGAASTIAGKRTYLDSEGESTDVDKYTGPVIPALGLILQSEDITFSMHYYQDYCMNDLLDIGPSTYSFTGRSGTYTISTRKQLTTIRQSTAQAALTFALDPAVSITAGVLTRGFHYGWDPTVIPKVVYEHGLFNRYQVLAGVMASPWEIFSAYCYGVSQNSQVRLSDGILRLPNATIIDSSAKVSYYGTVGYGIQAGIGSKLKVSLEMRHLFLQDSSNVLDSDGRYLHERRCIWNNEVSIGATFSVRDNIQIGARYSRFLKYNNYMGRVLSLSHGVIIMKISNPYSLAFDSQVRLGFAAFKATYQYSHSQYEHEGWWIFSDATHSVSLIAEYDFSL
jgi:hypothetical protein